MTTKTETDLSALSDAELETMAARALGELDKRRRERREAAIAQIRALAGEAGLGVTFKGDGRRGPKRRDRASVGARAARRTQPEPAK